jgi:CheY-like chemotaxis protein
MAVAGGGIRFVVEDSGPPIPGDLLPTLFEPFSRGDVYPSRDGGLALPISSQLAHLMGGELSVENLDGAGSRFSLYLPLLAVEEVASPSFSFMSDETDLSAPFVPAVPSASTGLLVVEADADHRAAWVAIAAAAGYHASGFSTRAEALAELRHRADAGQPAALVIFSDHDALGYEDLGKEILDDAHFASPALIMLPAVGNPGDARRLQDAGFRGYLVKPVAPSDLRETLETLRRTPRQAWYNLFLTRHSLAESRRGGVVPDAELEASLGQLIGEP